MLFCGPRVKRSSLEEDFGNFMLKIFFCFSDFKYLVECIWYFFFLWVYLFLLKHMHAFFMNFDCKIVWNMQKHWKVVNYIVIKIDKAFNKVNASQTLFVIFLSLLFILKIDFYCEGYILFATRYWTRAKLIFM